MTSKGTQFKARRYPLVQPSTCICKHTHICNHTSTNTHVCIYRHTHAWTEHVYIFSYTQLHIILCHCETFTQTHFHRLPMCMCVSAKVCGSIPVSWCVQLYECMSGCICESTSLNCLMHDYTISETNTNHAYLNNRCINFHHELVKGIVEVAQDFVQTLFLAKSDCPAEINKNSKHNMYISLHLYREAAFGSEGLATGFTLLVPLNAFTCTMCFYSNLVALTLIMFSINRSGEILHHPNGCLAS